MQIGIASNYLGQIFLKQKKYAASVQSALQAFEIFQQEGLLEEQHTAAEIMSEAYALKGDHANAYKYLLKSKQLGDSLASQKYDEEIASMQTAFKVEEKNNDQLYAAMEKLILDASLRQQLGQNARTIAEQQFDMAVLGPQLADIYNQAIEGL